MWNKSTCVTSRLGLIAIHTNHNHPHPSKLQTVMAWQLYSGFRLHWWEVAIIPFYGPYHDDAFTPMDGRTLLTTHPPTPPLEHTRTPSICPPPPFSHIHTHIYPNNLTGYAKIIVCFGLMHRFFSHRSWQCARPTTFVLGCLSTLVS